MKNIFLTLFLGLTSVLFGQNSISGVVTDADFQPLANVSVQLHGINKGTSTDEQGKFEFRNVPKADLEISFIMDGFDPHRQSVKVDSKTTLLEVQLQKTLHQMDEVVISTVFNKLQSENVVKVEHANIREMQREGILTVADGLAVIPGVSQLSTGTSIGKPVIRGLTGNRVLVYSQGIRMENQQFGDEHGIGLNSNGFESVEVIKGPASLLYGSDAVGGVIYFNPEKYADAGKFAVNVSQRLFSNTLGSETSLGAKGSTQNWKYLLRGSSLTHSDYKVADGKRVTNTRFGEIDLKGGIAFSSGRFATDLRYNYNKLGTGIPEDGISNQSTSKSLLSPNQNIKSHIASLHNTYFFEEAKLDATIGYTSNNRQEFEESNAAALDMVLNTLSYDVKFTFPKMRKLELIGGLQGLFQTNENFGEEALIPDATITDAGAFTTARIEFGRDHVIQAGIRIDSRKIETQAMGEEGEEGYFEALSRDFKSFNASLGYKFGISSQTAIRFNAASGFRAPNLAELTSNGVHEGSNRFEIGNANLDNEQNIQLDLNFEFDTQHFNFYANGFYNHINGYIYTSPENTIIDDHDIFRYTQDDALLYGGEMGLHFHPHPLDWLHLESSFETVTGKKQSGGYLPLIPANNWRNIVRTEFSIGKWLHKGFARAELVSTFSQDNVDVDETTSRGYTLLNLGVGGNVRIGKTVIDVSLAANNILDKAYIPHLSRLKTDNISNLGRNIILNLNLNLF